MSGMVTSSEVNGRLWGSRARDWADLQEGQCLPVYEAVFERALVGPHTVYLDAGCGAGLAAQIASRLRAKISALDASSQLLEIALQRVPNGDFRVGELEQLPFADRTFDLVTGFNSFQYAANPEAALAEAKRVARPGGAVAVMTWGPPAGMPAASLVTALRPLLPPPAPGAPGPFALSEESALRNFVERIGLASRELMDVDSPWRYPDEATAIRGLNSSGVAAKAIATSGEDAVTEAHRKALRPFLLSDGSYLIGASFRCLFAQA
jgi:SAM-dependent methyltransferase